jgi:broad specificity polyphosphatase/5'/3'-nucleotidase SurE
MPKGVRAVPQATGGFHEYYVPKDKSSSEAYYQLAGGGHRPEAAPADTTALAEGFITVTALRADMTDHAKTDALGTQLADIEL